jgi:glutathione S-transferase
MAPALEDEMRLFYARYTRATRPRWLLEEAGAPYELERIDLRAGDQKRPEYLRIHPHGVVPALEVDGQVIYESGAIVLYLADRFPGLAPEVGSAERARYYQWVAYALNTLEPVVAQYASHTRFLPEDRRVPSVADDAKGKFRQMADNLTQALGGRASLLTAFSAADILVGSVLMWGKSMGLLEEFPALLAYVKQLSARPAYQRASAD